MQRFDIVKELSKEQVGRYIALLEAEVAPRLERSEAGYARGRLNAWLKWQPSFDSDEAAARPTGRLWSALRELVPAVETAECWFNGRESSKGIHPHRDAAYAQRMAHILNLGPARFRIWLPRSEPAHPALVCVKRNRKYDEHAAELVGGELIRFDCKLLHGSTTAADARWGIGLWSFRQHRSAARES